MYVIGHLIYHSIFIGIILPEVLLPAAEHTGKLCLSIYLGRFPPVWGGSRQHKRNKQKQWGFHSVLPAMTRDPAEFGWHCWSNTTHPPPSSTTYVALIDAVSPTAPTTGLPLQGNPVATADANQNCVTIIRHSFLFLARSLASLISILLSFRALFTPSIHPNLGLPLALLPSTFAFITFFSSRSLSILSTWPNHLKTFTSTLAANSVNYVDMLYLYRTAEALHMPFSEHVPNNILKAIQKYR